jgi:glycine/D-amino acid oxidase-like deaminating enzyme
VIICGGGVIGASTAFYLSKRGCKPTIIERCELAAAASGKAGGFLAADWSDGSPVGPLARASFQLHDELAREIGADTIDYRRLTCAAVAVADRASAPAPKKLANIEWADGGALGSRPMGDESTIAQVHPRKLTLALVEAAIGRGATVRIGTVTEVQAACNGAPARVCVGEDEWLEADAVVLAMGPWTDQLRGALRMPAMRGQKYHSVLLQAERTLTQAVFFQGRGDPEVYPRPRGEVYVTGFPDSPVVVVEKPGAVEVRAEMIEQLDALARDLASELVAATRTGAQSCYLPLTADGEPAIGQLRDAPGVYVGVGHSCWGILNAPATGKALAELIVDGTTSIPLGKGLSPDRFLV